jgi:LemA protein
MSDYKRKGDDMLIAIAVIVVLAVILAGIYNSLVVKRNKVENQWSQIEVQLKRRFDLIPNLVNTVKGYAAHESKTLEAVTGARTKFMSASTAEEKMQANGELSGILGRLFAVAEAYPDLKANTNFLQLQDELGKTEDKIAFSRQFYNDVVMEYNNAVAMFPTNIVAGMFGFRAKAFFRTEEEAYKAPEVKF